MEIESMFLDLRDAGPPPPPWHPSPPRRLTPKRERMIGWILGFNLLMLVVGPLAGASVLEAIGPLLAR